MEQRIGAFFLGALLVSVLLSAKKRQIVDRSLAPPNPPPPSRLYALVQTRPSVVVLAVSGSRNDLVGEMHELNETWNHWDIRTERYSYEIQPASVLVQGVDPGARLASAGTRDLPQKEQG